MIPWTLEEAEAAAWRSPASIPVGLPRPEFDYLCTCNLARRVWPDLPSYSLDTLAAHIGHKFHHHHAQADAEAAGRVLLGIMKYANARTPSELLGKMGMVPRRFS